jgi:short subunit dehydrogenase-like uncharacterized protein
MTPGHWLIYGANGYTGEMIAREAVRRGLRPVLAGRNRAAIEALGAELGCGTVIVSLDDRAGLRRALESPSGTQASVVLHCAGPFSATAAPMLQACLEAGAHYLDITGEIDVFESAQALDERARSTGVVMCPGAGFDVVPTDCVAAALKSALPSATYLALGFDTPLAMSRGTARTSIEGLGGGGRIRSAGRLVTVAHAFRERQIDFGDGMKTAVTIPWGDVSTAWHTTRIPNIEVYVPMPAARIRALKSLNRVRALLRSRTVQSLLKRRVDRTTIGPDAAARAATPAFIWGEAQTPSGERCSARIRVANPYDVTVHAALGLVERVAAHAGEGGYFTPSQLGGAGFVESLPGSGRIELAADRAWQAGGTGA